MLGSALPGTEVKLKVGRGKVGRGEEALTVGWNTDSQAGGLRAPGSHCLPWLPLP